MNYHNPKSSFSMTSNNSELNKEESSLEQSEEINDSPSDLNPISTASTTDIPSFGWSEYAERVNGRFAMVGFVAILIIEILSHSNFLKWAGFIS